MTVIRISLALIAYSGLAACGAATPPPKAAAPAPVRPAPNAYIGASSQAPVELVGKDARALQSLFGQPRLDVREGTGRKLQYLNESCVLDTYLYPQRAGSEATVTYAEARDRQGRDMAASACIAHLRQR